VLKRRRYAVISTPNLAATHEVASLILGLQPFNAHVSDEAFGLGHPFNPRHMLRRQAEDQSHLRLFTLGALRELFILHGFKVEKIIGVGYCPLPMTIARLLARLDPRHSTYLIVKVRKT